MKPRTMVFLASALLILPAGVEVLGGQREARPPAPPAVAVPAMPLGVVQEPGEVFVPAVPVPPGPPVVFEFAEPPELPEPPDAPEPPEAPEPVVAGQSMVLLGDGGTWLGVRLSDVTAEKARELKLSAEDGAVVIEVEPDSPAAKAGLEKDDVILQFAGERVHSVAQLQRLVRETPAGRSVSLGISRGGQARALSAKIEGGWGHYRMPHFEVPGVRAPNMFYFFHGRQTLGVTGEELTRQLADYFGVKEGKGVLVSEVKTGSAAEKAGLKAGDVIVGIDGKPVGSVEELRGALPQDLEEKKKVSLSVVRDRREQTFAVELEPQSRGPMRRSERIEIPQVDLAEIKRLAAEGERQAGPLQDQVRQLVEQKQCWMREAERALKQQREAWQQAQRAMKEQLKRDVGLKEREGREGVI